MDIKRLQGDFKRGLPQRLYELEHACNELFSAGATLSVLTELHGKVGNIVALGSVAGAVQLSIMARTLERQLDEALQTPAAFDDAKQKLFQYHFKKFIKQAERWQHREEKAEADEVPGALLYLLDESGSLLRELESLEYCDYQIRHFHDLNSLLEAAAANRPAVILMVLVFADSDQNAEENKRLAALQVPLIVICSEEGIDSRLAAARIGADRFFAKPVDMAKLKVTLDGLTTHSLSNAYRVLIVEEDAFVAESYAAILRKAGCVTLCLYRPLEIFSVLQSFNPELVLMGGMWPDCDALELAAVLRQDEGYNQLPIVFLSGERKSGERITVMNLEWDEFLYKPIDVNYLVSVVLSRIKRKRWVEQLNQELHNSIRESEYLRVAMNRHVILSIADIRGDIIHVNDNFCEISGYQVEELIGHNHRLIKSNFHSPAFYRDLWQTISRGDIWQGEICNQRKDGEHYWVESTIVPFLDEQGHPYQYISVRTDITHIKDAEERLIQARDFAEQANQAKTEFISHMSHELRTPLNAILGYAQLFEYDQGLDDKQHKSAHEIYRAGQHLLGLVNEVLDLSRIERGCLELSIELVDLGQLIDECKQLLALQISEREIHFESDNCQRVVKADYSRLKQVLLNLLSNAIKYNNQGGSILVKCCSDDESVIRISIDDSGNGIPENRLEELFQPFNRLGEERGEIEGAGIGLVLSKRLIEMMEGRIGAESVTGEGSRFWFEIPVADKALPHTELEEDEQGEASESLLSGELRTICYVEDNPANLRLMERVIEQHGKIQMLHAVTAEEGIELVRTALPELVLMDINLPGMDGYEALSILRDDPRTCDIPVMAITANAMPQDVERGYREGFVEYMTKPLNIKLFLETLDRLLGVEKDANEK